MTAAPTQSMPSAGMASQALHMPTSLPPSLVQATATRALPMTLGLWHARLAPELCQRCKRALPMLVGRPQQGFAAKDMPGADIKLHGQTILSYKPASDQHRQFFLALSSISDLNV